jgi:hypothetical protein
VTRDACKEADKQICSITMGYDRERAMVTVWFEWAIRRDMNTMMRDRQRGAGSD